MATSIRTAAVAGLTSKSQLQKRKGHTALQNLLPADLKTTVSSGNFCLWHAAIQYINRLTGISTQAIGPIHGKKFAKKRNKQLLKQLIPSGYHVADDEVLEGPLLASWAASYIKDELTVVQNQEDKDSSDASEPERLNEDTSDSPAKEEDDTGVLSAMITLRENISTYKKIEIDFNDPEHVMALVEEMIDELTKGANDISKFGARGDGDFEKMAWAVYHLRSYFIEEVDDDSSIANLLQLINLSVQLAKVLRDASNTLKACVEDGIPAEEQFTARQNKKQSTPSNNAGISQKGNAPIESGPSTSFGFCSASSSSKVSSQAGSMASTSPKLNKGKSINVDVDKPAPVMYDQDMDDTPDLYSWGCDWSSNINRLGLNLQT